MDDNQITCLIDVLTLSECITVLAICASDLPHSVFDDLMNDPDQESAAIRARQLVRDIRRMQDAENK